MGKETAFPLLNLWCRDGFLDCGRTKSILSSQVCLEFSSVYQNVTIAGKCAAIWNQWCMQSRWSLLALFLSFYGLYKLHNCRTVPSHCCFSQKLQKVLIPQAGGTKTEMILKENKGSICGRTNNTGKTGEEMQFFQVPFRYPNHIISSHILKDKQVKMERERCKATKKKYFLLLI